MSPTVAARAHILEFVVKRGTVHNSGGSVKSNSAECTMNGGGAVFQA